MKALKKSNPEKTDEVISVSDIMTDKVITANPEEQVSKVFGLMQKYNLKNIPIVIAGDLIGMITLHEVIGQHKFGMEIKVSTLMFTPPVLKSSDDVSEVINLITETGVTAVPVVEGNRVIGIVSDHDVLKVMKGELSSLYVSDLMRVDVPLLSIKEPAGKATRLMDYHKLKTMPVIDSKSRLLGVIYDIDILSIFNKPRENAGSRMKEGRGGFFSPMSTPVRDIMSRVYSTLKPYDRMSKAIELMIKKDLNSVVVINDEEIPVGVLERKSLIGYLYKKVTPKGVLLNFTGMHLDYSTNQLLTNVLQDHLLRVKYLATGLHEVKVYLKPIHEGGGVRKYELNLTIYQRGGGVLRTEKIGYDLRAVFDDALTDLERVIVKNYKKKGYDSGRNPPKF